MCFDTKTTSETTIQPPTAEERALMDLSSQMMMTYMNEAGYEVTKTTVGFDESQQGQNFASRRQKLQSRRDELASKDPSNREIGVIDAQLSQLSGEEQAARSEYEPKTTYQSREKADFATERIRSQYGADSPEYRKALKQYEEKRIAKDETLESIEMTRLNRTKKVLEGDFSLNAGEEKFMREIMGPLRKAGLNAINYFQKSIGGVKEGAKARDITESKEDFFNRVSGTKMSISDALVAMEHRIEQTGADMNKALDEEISTTKQLVKMGIEDFNSEQRKNISMQASLLGRSSTDPEFQAELQARANREISKSQLQLGQYAAGQRMAIAERTGAGLERTAASRVGFAEEGARLDIEAAKMRGQTEVGLAQTGANLRKDLAYGMAPTQVGLGMDAANYQNALLQQRMQNLAVGQGMPLTQYQVSSQERYRQPTTTQTESQGIGNVVTGLIGTGLTAAATAYSGGAFGGGK